MSIPDPATPDAVSLLPLDVGFDLKTAGVPVVLTSDPIVVKYIDADGRRMIACGDRIDVAAELRSAGYVVAQFAAGRGDGEFTTDWTPSVDPCPHCGLAGEHAYRLWICRDGGRVDVKRHCRACDKTWWKYGDGV